MQLTENFTLKDFTRSRTAIRLNIPNVPDEVHIEAIKELAVNVLQPARTALKTPIFVASGYRCPKLNEAIGSKPGSQHEKAEAADVECNDNAKLFNWIAENCDFDQLIWEHGDETQPDWVHVSYTTRRDNRKEKLIAKKIKGKTVYQRY
jgi:hypothetical protein